jgi:hypothetical protein
MAEVKSMKLGRLYVAEGGSNRPLLEQGANACDLFEHSDGTVVMLYATTTGDIARVTGNHPLAVGDGTTAGTTVVNETNAISSLAAVQVGSTTHLFYGYDPGAGTAYSVHYRSSTDGGATWSSSSEVITEASGSWDSASVEPVGATYDATNAKVHVFVRGYTGSIYTVGEYSIDTADDFTTSGNYDANASNPVFPNSGGMSNKVTVVFDDERRCYHMWHGDDNTPTNAYHQESEDGTTWAPTTRLQRSVLRVGPSGTFDDTQVSPSGGFFYERRFYLTYIGFDGASTLYPMIAVGDTADNIYKVGHIDHLSSGDYSEVAWATGDLSYTQPPTHVHADKRGGARGSVGCSGGAGQWFIQLPARRHRDQRCHHRRAQ